MTTKTNEKPEEFDFGFAHIDNTFETREIAEEAHTLLQRQLQATREHMFGVKDLVDPLLKKLEGKPGQDMIQWPYDVRQKAISDFRQRLWTYLKARPKGLGDAE